MHNGFPYTLNFLWTSSNPLCPLPISYNLMDSVTLGLPAPFFSITTNSLVAAPSAVGNIGTYNLRLEGIITGYASTYLDF